MADTIDGVDLGMIGTILMVVGVVGLLLSLLMVIVRAPARSSNASIGIRRRPFDRRSGH